MSSPTLHYLLLELQDSYELWRFRSTLIEMMQDSGFRVDLQTSAPFMPLAQDLETFELQFQACKRAQRQAIQGQDADGVKESKAPEAKELNHSSHSSHSSHCEMQAQAFFHGMDCTDPLARMAKGLASFAQPRQSEGQDTHMADMSDDQKAAAKEAEMKKFRECIDRLAQVLEWSLFLYAKQDPDHISNQASTLERCDPIVSFLYQPWIDQVKASQASQPIGPGPCIGPCPQPPKDILVVFCRQDNVNTVTYNQFMRYLQHYGISDGVLVSTLGAGVSIVKRMVTDSAENWNKLSKANAMANAMPNQNAISLKPTIRVMPYRGKCGLLHNVMRYQRDEPLYRRLNAFEVQVMQCKYGTASKFPKLLKSAPVCQYFGFRVGDVVLPLTAQKKIHQNDLEQGQEQENGTSWYGNVQDQMESMNSWIDELRPCIVIDT